jgi:hypothetical protein
MGRPSVSSPPISFGNGFGGSMGSQSMSRTETRAGRGSSEGSRSVSEVESEGSRPFLRSLTLLEGLSDLAVAVELSKEEWRLFSQIRVGLPACDRSSSRIDTDVCADLSLETTCVKSWEASGTRQSDTLWLISTTSRLGKDSFHLLMLNLHQPV